MRESLWEQGFVKDDQSFQDEKEESGNIFCFVVLSILLVNGKEYTCASLPSF